MLVPVGLFGLVKKTMRVLLLILAAIPSRSIARDFKGTYTGSGRSAANHDVVHEKGGLGHYRLIPWQEQCTCQHADNVVRTGSDHDLFRGHPELFRQFVDQFIAAAVGVAIDLLPTHPEALSWQAAKNRWDFHWRPVLWS